MQPPPVMISGLAAPLVIQLTANVLGKAKETAQVIVPLTLTWETWMNPIAGFSLAQLQLLRPLE